MPQNFGTRFSINYIGVHERSKGNYEHGNTSKSIGKQKSLSLIFLPIPKKWTQNETKKGKKSGTMQATS